MKSLDVSWLIVAFALIVGLGIGLLIGGSSDAQELEQCEADYQELYELSVGLSTSVDELILTLGSYCETDINNPICIAFNTVY